MSDIKKNKSIISESEEKEKIKKSNKIIAIINVSSFFAFIGVVSILLFTLDRPVVSEIENRKLSSFPELSLESFFSGDYTDSISIYYNDTVPGRDDFKRIAANMKKFLGITPENAEVHGNLIKITNVNEAESTNSEKTSENITAEENNGIYSADENGKVSDPIIKENSLDTTSTHVETTVQEPQTTEAVQNLNTENEIAEGVYTNGQIVVFQNGHWRGISMFGGGTGTVYAESLNAFKRDLGDNINVYSMVIPTGSAFYTPSNFAKYNASHLESINSINALLNNVINVDVYSVLDSKKSEPVYTRTDHHWQPLGAYYAAEEFAKTADVPFAGISGFTPVVIENYVGTMYSFTESANLLGDPEEFIYYKPNNNYTAYYYTSDYTFEYEFPLFVTQPVGQSYSTFMGGDNKIVRIETDVKNNRRLAVLKDSYGNAEIPFLVNSFEEIYVIDIRYFKPNAIDFIINNNITDVLFSMCTFSAVGVNAENINVIRTQ